MRLARLLGSRRLPLLAKQGRPGSRARVKASRARSAARRFRVPPRSARTGIALTVSRVAPPAHLPERAPRQRHAEAQQEQAQPGQQLTVTLFCVRSFRTGFRPARASSAISTPGSIKPNVWQGAANETTSTESRGRFGDSATRGHDCIPARDAQTGSPGEVAAAHMLSRGKKWRGRP